MDLTVVFGESDPGSDSALEELRGRGVALETRQGADALDGSGEYVLLVPAGVRLAPGVARKMWEKRVDTEAVLGSRYVRGGRARFGFPASLVARRGNRLLRRVLRLPVNDPTSPLRLYKRSALKEIALDSRDPLEILVELQNAGFKIREVPYEESGRAERGGLSELFRSFTALPRLRRRRSAPESADRDDALFESAIPWRRRYEASRQRTIVSFLEVDVPVLDVGCGSSRLIQTLGKGIGLDKDRRKLRFLRGRAKATVSGDLSRLPFRDGSFRQAVFSDVLSTLSPDEPYLPELRRILAPYGTLVLATPQDSRHDEAWLRAELSSHGFTIDEVRKVKRELVVRAIRKESESETHQDGGVGAGSS
jgi:SAM-dependent methyltransferase